MASFPTGNVHRRSRRKLGRGQYPVLPSVTAALTDDVTDVTIDFDQPVIVSGPIDLHLTRITPAVPALLTQVVVSTTQVLQTYASTVVGCDYAVGPEAPVKSHAGGGLAVAVGTF